MRFDQSAILKVGEGRGFVIGAGDDRYVITAAHCLPHIPHVSHVGASKPRAGGSISHIKDRTYEALLGPLQGNPSVWAECIFFDLIHDIAVLGPPDGQDPPQGPDRYRRYEELVQEARPLRIGKFHTDPSARLLHLDGSWMSCNAKVREYGAIFITKAVNGIVGGMSGSPIVAEDDIAIGVVTTSSGNDPTQGGPQARLSHHLPGWLLEKSKVTEL